MDGKGASGWQSRVTRGGLAVAIGWMAALWSGFILAELGQFTAWPPLVAAVLAGGFAWRYRRDRQQDDGPAPDNRPAGLAAACALALLSLVFALPPSEFLLGGWDPGVYLHTAAGLARGGDLLQQAPDLARMDAASRALIGRQGQDAWEPFLGMRMLPDGRLSPQFYHLYPVLMALAWPLGGARAALMVNPFLNALAIVLMYLWACRWVRPRWAFAAALLLALNPAQIWQAGFGTAELLAQCLLLIGLLATDRALSSGANNRLEAVVAGAAFGLMLLTRYDAVLFVVPLVLVLLTGLRHKSQRGQLVLLLGTTALLGVHAGVHQVFFSPLYHPMGNWVLPGLVAAGGAALVIATVALLNPPRDAAASPVAARRRRGLRLATAAGFAAWVLFAWYVRPHLTVEGRVLTLFMRLIPGAGETGWFAFLAGRNARNFWYLKSLFGTAGLIAALTGIGILIVRKQPIWKTAWLAAAIAALVLLMTQISHEPFMMFVSRRMVPVALPLLCLGVAALCDGGDRLLRRHPRGGGRASVLAGVLAGVLVLALPLAGTLGGTVFLATQREWPGLAAWLDPLAAQLPPGAVVYSDAPGFAAPLRFLYGIPAYEVRALNPGHRQDPMPMMMAGTERHDVFWLTWNDIPEAYADAARPTATLPLRSVILGTTKYTVPRYIRPRTGAFTLYRIGPDRR